MQAQHQRSSESEEEHNLRSRSITTSKDQDSNNLMMSSQQHFYNINKMPYAQMMFTSSSQTDHQSASDPLLTQNNHNDLGDEGVSIFHRENHPYQMPSTRYMELTTSRALAADDNRAKSNFLDFHQPHDAGDTVSHDFDAFGISKAHLNTDIQNFSSRAHAMTAQLDSDPDVTVVGTRKRPFEHDRENHKIKRLRIDEQWQWSDIANELNRQRIVEGKEPTFTDTAVYSRLVRSGPRIAQSGSDAAFDPKEHLNVEKKKKRHGGGQSSLPTANFTDNQYEALADSFTEIRGMFWEQVAEMMERKTGKKFSPQDCATRWHQV